LFLGCISESSLKPIVPMQILHSNSAKVWVLESNVVNDVEKSPRTRDFQTAFILYNDGEFIEQKMVHLGSSKGKLGFYSLSISPETNDTLFVLNYKKNNQNMSFHLKKVTSMEIYLEEVVQQDTDEQRFWTLKSLPKPVKWY
jgi:hypothetical protein